MALRWSMGLPGPFYLSGRVFPRMPHGRRTSLRALSRDPAVRAGGRFMRLLLVGTWWLGVGMLIVGYWMYLGFIAGVWWVIASIVERRLLPWPVPAHAWRFWRHTGV
ncbi:hypothetical protein [Curtobacterium sp. MCBD17_040]|uniref:hypothetical protein n=1 Tax=Curtobacterium sp. MCBD17_040 TaxID=2175674 RepID=UPI0011B4A9F5|nr:hypothetical protein [Curtobacterium sp. MCBD17_040]WIB65436.1 hypothetical protein DEI94_18700 [Curtobacterium sp. MCBD17_040]